MIVVRIVIVIVVVMVPVLMSRLCLLFLFFFVGGYRPALGRGMMLGRLHGFSLFAGVVVCGLGGGGG